MNDESKVRSMPRAYVYFHISGEYLPLEQITREMGMEPTEQWSKGDRGKYVNERQTSGWSLRGPLDESNTVLRDHIEAFLPILETRIEAVKRFSENFDTYLVSVGYYNETASPGLSLSRSIVARIAALGLAFDADLYFAKDK